MSDSQPMSPMLCQGMNYLPLEEDDKFTTTNIASTTYVPHLIIGDVMDDEISSDEYIG